MEQWLAYQSHSLMVGGSNPPPATKINVLVRSLATANQNKINASLAQLVEHLTLNQGVQGSNP